MIDFPTAAFHLAIALAFGVIIGAEREWRQKQAGMKTMALVAVGAAAFAMLSDTFGPNNHNPGQIAAAVVGGIGFLGAGMIMRRGITVQGLTTAAALWASASVGVAVGLRQLPVATCLTALIFLLQTAGRRVEQHLRRIRRKELPGRFELRVESTAEALHRIGEIWAPYGPPVTRSVVRNVEGVTVRLVLRATEAVDLGVLEEQLVALEGVKRVDLRHLGIEDEA